MDEYVDVLSMDSDTYQMLQSRAADMGMSVREYVAFALMLVDELPLWLLVAISSGEFGCDCG